MREDHRSCEINKNNNSLLHVHSLGLAFCSRVAALHGVVERGWPMAEALFSLNMRGWDPSIGSDPTRHHGITISM
jgi:hypothetical protein